MPSSVVSNRPTFPDPGDLLRQGLWKKTDEQVVLARRQFKDALASGKLSPREVADAAVSCFGGIAAKLYESARSLVLLNRHRPDASELADQSAGELESRLVAARKAVLKDATVGLTKRAAKELHRRVRPKLDAQIGSVLRELGDVGPGLERVDYVPTKRQTVRSLNRQVEILFLAADPRRDFAGKPASRESLELDEEYRAIQERIRKGSHRDFLDLRACWAVRTQDLLDALNEHRPRIVHFSGHGRHSEGVVLLAPDGRPEPVGPHFLVQVFSTLTDATSVVVLNACYSKRQAEAIAQVVGATIGTERSITDESAIAFSEAFYGAIANNQSVDTAFRQAEAVLTSVRREHRPTLLLRPGLDPRLLRLIKVPDKTNYEPLGRGLRAAVTQFLAKRTQHSTALASLAQSFDEAGGGAPSVSLAAELSRLIQRLPTVVGEIVQEAEDFIEDLEGVCRRWAPQLTAEAVSKLTHLEEIAADHKKHVARLSRHLMDLQLRPLLADPADLLPRIASSTRELGRLVQLSWRSVALAYNMLLEFLPGDLLERGVVKLVEVKL